ncbi:MAG: PAS domain S-box protein [Candidatus Methanoperedens sp.]|nr:PAS domain S-box protein [Candidatus Methanoperedens sp.]
MRKKVGITGLEKQNGTLLRKRNEIKESNVRDNAHSYLKREEIVSSELKWQKTFDALNDSICLLDMKGKILQCNRAMCDFMKMQMSDIIGKTCWVLVHGTAGPIDGCPVERMKETRKRETMLLSINERWFNVTADPLFDETEELIGAVHIIQDITGRKKIEEELLSEKAFTEMIIDSLPETFYMIDHEGKFIRWNKAIEELTGYPAEKLRGMNALQIIHEDDRKLVSKKIQEVFEKGSAHAEVRIITKNGERIHLLTGKRMVIGKEMYLIGSGLDITERKHTEEALLQISDRLKLATSAAKIGIWDLDLINNKLVWDDKMYQLYGIMKESFSGAYEAWEACLNPDDLIQEREKTQMALRGEKEYDTEFCVLWPDKSVHYIKANGMVQRDSSGRAVRMLGTNWDITEIKEATKAISESELRFRTLLENARDGILVADINTKKFIMSNKMMCMMLGYSPVEIRSLSVVDIHPEKDLGRALETFEKQAKEEPVSNTDIPVKRKDGTVFYADINTSLINVGGKKYLLGLFRDTTERRRADETLKVSEERYRKLAEAAHDAIFTIDCDNNRIQYINSFAANNMGFLPEEIIGQKIETIFPSEKTDLMKQNVQKICLKGEPFYTEERISLQNQEHWQSSWLVPIKDTAGRVNEVMGISRDITTIKRTEDDLRIAKVEAESANMVKTNFLHTMSHELRTPLNAILGFSEMLKHGELNEKQKHFVDNIIEGGKNLHNVIGQILEVVRLDEGQLELSIENIPVHEIVNEVLSVIKEKATVNNIIIKINIDPRLEYIQADKQKLKKILISLLDNAVKFSKREGGIIKINIKQDKYAVRFSVSDTGIGIKEEDMTNLFRKFTQLDSGMNRKYGGIGIGLVIAKQFVEMQGGTIKAESKYGEGSTFTFTLPIAMRRKEKYNDKSTCS